MSTASRGRYPESSRNQSWGNSSPAPEPMDRLCVALNNSCRGSCLNHKWNSRFTAAFFIFYLHVFQANKLSGKQSGDGPKKEKPGNDKLAGEAPRGRRIVALRSISRPSFSDRLCVAIKTKKKKPQCMRESHFWVVAAPVNHDSPVFARQLWSGSRWIIERDRPCNP